MDVDFTILSTVNASLNTLSGILLLAGFIHIKKGNIQTHKKWMIAAFVTSVVFLISYLIYHYEVGSVPYPHYDWTRPIYFAILIPHIILAAVMMPFILALLWFAWREKFDKHRALARWVWPVWMFVSVGGVVIYLMLYHL